MMAAVFSMQGLGQLGGALVMLILTAGFKGSLKQGIKHTTNGATVSAYASCSGDCQVAVDKMWRALIGKTRGMYALTVLPS